MTYVTTAAKLAAKAKDIALNYKTLYVSGCFGAPLNANNKPRYCNNNAYNRAPDRTAMIKAASADTFGFDCVNLLKAIFWGWSGDKNKEYGGAAYNSNGVPDIDDGQMFAMCSNVSADFSKIEIGEAVWLPGHIGVYVGDGLSVECTPSWANKVQITACNCVKNGYNTRIWTRHGKLPWVDYTAKEGDTMTGQEIYTALNEYLATQKVPEWAKAEFQEAIDMGITDGSNPMQLIPRYQAAIMAKRKKQG